MPHLSCKTRKVAAFTFAILASQIHVTVENVTVESAICESEISHFAASQGSRLDTWSWLFSSMVGMWNVGKHNCGVDFAAPGIAIQGPNNCKANEDCTFVTKPPGAYCVETLSSGKHFIRQEVELKQILDEKKVVDIQSN